MILSKTLKKNNIIIKAKSTNKWDLIEEMLDLAVKNNEVNKENRDLIRNTLFDREKSMTTGIGRGIAIPHCSTDAIEDIVLVLSLCENGVDFESADSIPVQIAAFLLVPKSKLKQHIKTLANIAKLLNNDELRENLLQSKKAETVLKTIKNYEKALD